MSSLKRGPTLELKVQDICGYWSPYAPVSFDADASGTTLTFSCRPYSRPPDLYNSRDSTPSDAIYEIVERYVEAMHAFLSFARAFWWEMLVKCSAVLPHAMPVYQRAAILSQRSGVDTMRFRGCYNFLTEVHNLKLI
ncbi:uncharacterized protein LACBIDRAFT_325774 [Laccaria bicolor S238N-H82]|uniref:Predicted protein n=1 Tax=Laccaria bicolor (strain S238N-H82 / ATCC MYA-4686) TaxID=486041 RepID=B0D662_LACBS|nr:uncharacterized protein LACBIDRAFT_325774 [Laccaria bicolor S238N-H82]EDR09887.1 predicted protein [Laccaria bicolor S238N-H82]|eukprot:XP_001879272.1 predicted protein [Laccaria bicolor S238N-H82]